ncbi:MAG TPA: dihydroneopterin aldolase [Bacteroidota bacterium]|nr:dihydroneopterin aldolase [Bacteroidota bacterium]
MKKLDIIRLHNAVFYAYHGVMSDEQNLGGKFEVDVELYCDLSEAKEKDDLLATVNYEKVYAVMKQTVVGKKFFLIEALAHSIAKGIFSEFPAVHKTVVRIRKPGAAVHGIIDHVEVEVESSRDERP